MRNFTVLPNDGSSNAFAKVNNILTDATTTSSLYLVSNTQTSELRNSTTNLSMICDGNTGLMVYKNGIVQVNNNAANNKMLVLYEQAITDTPSTATNFFGFGINTNTLRYQVPAATNSHKFYCGSTISYTISNGVGNSGSDIRFKSNVENITNALEKINNIQGKTFIYNGNTKKQLGFIAQEIYDVEPLLVSIDTDTEDKFMFLQYDRFCALHNEGVKELNNKIKALEDRINILENKI